jgi:hypothetical protein
LFLISVVTPRAVSMTIDPTGEVVSDVLSAGEGIS